MAATADDLFGPPPTSSPTPWGAPATDASAAKRSPPKTGTVFSSRGRIGVRTYWARVLCGLGTCGLAVAVVALGVRVSGATEDIATASIAAAAVLTLLPLFVLSIFWTIQRVHDLGLHGAFVVLSYVPVIGIAFGLYAGFAPGRVGDNAHGAPRPTTRAEKILGTIALVLVALFFVLAAYGGYLEGMAEV